MKTMNDEEWIENPWEEPTIEEARQETLAIFVGAACVISGSLSILFFVLWLVN
jgi:hypothetical protein